MPSNIVNTRINIHLKEQDILYKIGSIDITKPNNEFYYRPSQGKLSKVGIGSISEEKETLLKKPFELDHISFHKDGQVHMKDKSSHKEVIFQSKKRLDIIETGSTYLIYDYIKDPTSLPKSSEIPKEKDFTIDISENIGVLVKTCLISSENYLSGNINRLSQEDGLIDIEFRGTYDSHLMLVIGAFKSDIKIGRQRRFFFPMIEGKPREED